MFNGQVPLQCLPELLSKNRENPLGVKAMLRLIIHGFTFGVLVFNLKRVGCGGFGLQIYDGRSRISFVSEKLHRLLYVMWQVQPLFSTVAEMNRQP